MIGATENTPAPYLPSLTDPSVELIIYLNRHSSLLIDLICLKEKFENHMINRRQSHLMFGRFFKVSIKSMYVTNCLSF